MKISSRLMALMIRGDIEKMKEEYIINCYNVKERIKIAVKAHMTELIHDIVDYYDSLDRLFRWVSLSELLKYAGGYGNLEFMEFVDKRYSPSPQDYICALYSAIKHKEPKCIPFIASKIGDKESIAVLNKFVDRFDGNEYHLVKVYMDHNLRMFPEELGYDSVIKFMYDHGIIMDYYEINFVKYLYGVFTNNPVGGNVYYEMYANFLKYFMNKKMSPCNIPDGCNERGYIYYIQLTDKNGEAFVENVNRGTADIDCLRLLKRMNL